MARTGSLLINQWGGYNTTDHETKIRDNQLSGGQNIRILDHVIEKMQGYTKYNDTSLGITDYVQPWEYQTRDHSKYLMVNSATSLIQADNTSTSGDIDTLLWDGFTSNQLMCFDNYFNETWGTNGEDAVFHIYQEKPKIIMHDSTLNRITRLDRGDYVGEAQYNIDPGYLCGDSKYIYCAGTSSIVVRNHDMSLVTSYTPSPVAGDPDIAHVAENNQYIYYTYTKAGSPTSCGLGRALKASWTSQAGVTSWNAASSNYWGKVAVNATRVYVSDASGDIIRIWNSALSEVASYNATTNPIGLGADDTYWYLGLAGTNGILQFNVSDNSFVTSTTTGVNGPRSFYSDQTNKRLYVGMVTSNKVIVYNTSNMAFVTSFATAGTGLGNAMVVDSIYVDEFASRLKNKSIDGAVKPMAAIGDGASGINAGSYRWMVSYYDSTNGEGGWGEVSDALSITTTGDADVSIPPPVVGSPTVAKLYRNTSQSANTYFYVKDVTVGSVTTHTTDTATNAALSTTSTPRAPMVSQLTPKARYLKQYKDYMFLWSIKNAPTSLRWNMAGTDRYSFPATYELNLETDDGDEGTGLGLANGELYAFKRDSIHHVLTDAVDPLDWGQQQIHKGQGAVSHWSIQTIPNGQYAGACIFAGETGVHILSNDRVTYISRDIEKEWQLLDASYTSKIVSWLDVDRHEYWVSVPYSASGGTQATNNRCYVFNYMTGVWYPPYTKGFFGACHGEDSDDKPKVWHGGYTGHLTNYQDGLAFPFIAPTNSKFYAGLTSTYQASLPDGLAATAVGDIGFTSSLLDLRDGDGYAYWNTTSLGCTSCTIEFRITPDYTGIPDSNVEIVALRKGRGTNTTNTAYLLHQAVVGDLKVLMADSTGTSIYSISTGKLGGWSPTAGTEYTFSLNIKSGSVKLYIDGTATSTELTDAFTWTATHEYLILGDQNGTGAAGSGDFYLRNLIFYNTYLRTADYTVDWSAVETEIDGYFDTKAFDFGVPDNTKHFTEVTYSYREFDTAYCHTFYRNIDSGGWGSGLQTVQGAIDGKRQKKRRKLNDHGMFAKYRFRDTCDSCKLHIHSLQIDARIDKKR